MNIRMKTQGRSLFLDTGSIELEKPIERAVRFRGKIIVSFRYDKYERDDSNRERNVIAIDEIGNLLWRILQTPEAQIDENGNRRWNPYVGITIEKGFVRAYDAGGLCWKVNHETGEVFDAIFTR